MIRNFHFVVLTFTALLLLHEANAQRTMNYTSTWKKIDSLIQNRLPQSAMSEVDKLLAYAKKAKNENQYIKGILAKGYLTKELKEETWLPAIDFLQKELKTAGEPAKQIIHSNIAGLYQLYYNEQRHVLRNLTERNEDAGPDVAQWTPGHFESVIRKHYDSSLFNSPALQKIRLAEIRPFTNQAKDTHLRPTLYDLLMQDAIAFYEQDIFGTSVAIGDYKLNNPDVLLPLDDFISTSFSTERNRSKLWTTIHLYQEILKFHKVSNNTLALVDWDLRRLNFAKDQGSFSNKETLHKIALEDLYERFKNVEAGAAAGVELAEWYRNLGGTYHPETGNTETRNALVKALSLAESVASAWPGIAAGKRASNIVSELKQPSLGIRTEMVNSIGEPFRALMDFKNLKTVWLRIIRLPYTPESLSENDNSYEQLWWQRLVNMASVREWSQTLPDMDDLRNHNAEIRIDGLPQGRYMVLASSNPGFAVQKNSLAASAFYVSDIAYIHNNDDVFVLNRTTGQPLAGATVQLWHGSYNYTSRKQTVVRGATHTSNQDGKVTIPARAWDENRQQRTFYEFKAGNDRLMIANAVRDYIFPAPEPRENTEEQQAEYSIFLDRGLYRPGQILYFKAIGHTIDKNTGRSKRYSPETVKVQIKDANYQVVDSLMLRPNAYGSVNGSFKLPAGRLSGRYTIEVVYGKRQSQSGFQVEEYKRPQFYAEIDKIKETYKLGDSVKISGKAEAYAGNPVDGAPVQYRVYRTSSFYFPWRFARSIWPPYSREKVELANGITTTDEQGNFTIRFLAVPDLSVDEKWKPVFHYTVEADVTDRNGETRSATGMVSLSNISTLININETGGNSFDADSTRNLQLTAVNVQGEKVAADINVKVFKLIEPAFLLRKRFWEVPDTSVMSYAEFKRYFPNDPYQNEDEISSWKNGQLAWEKLLTGDSTYHVEIASKSLAPGVYRLIAQSAGRGDTAVAETIFMVYRLRTGEMPYASVLYDALEKPVALPGQNASFLFGSATNSPFIIEQTVKTKFENGRWKDLSNYHFINGPAPFKQLVYPVKEEDRGGYAVSRLMVYQNRIYQTNWQIGVPWSNKELNVKLETFRDKIRPGQLETWKIKISGDKKDAVAAELLASMYDASLDAIMPFSWSTFFPWRTNHYFFRWGSNDGFSIARSYQRSPDIDYHAYEINYPALMRIGYSWPQFGVESFSGRGREFYAMRNMAMAKGEVAMASDAVNEESHTGAPQAMADTSASTGVPPLPQDPAGQQQPRGIIRSDFRETAFFYPDLQTDKDGSVSFSFTTPDALTTWKLQLLAHSETLETGQLTKEIVSQKELMVQPFAPRFLRQGDRMEFTAKISNTTDNEITGTVNLEILNAVTMQPVDGWFNNAIPQQYFTVAGRQSTMAKFPFVVPMQFTDPVVYRIVANSENQSDGEEMAIPVLSNKILVIETLPIYLRKQYAKSINWPKLLQSDNSETLHHSSLTAEFTANPTWYAVQALPYLAEQKDETIVSTWNRFYANALASHIANSIPRLKAIFETWKTSEPTNLLSNLEKNQELKSALLEETPWVLQAKTETEQKKRIAELFELAKLAGEHLAAFKKLEEHQAPNGGLVWLKGMPDDRYMTMYVVSQLGHLRKLGAWPAGMDDQLLSFAKKAIAYLDNEMQEDYESWMKMAADPKRMNISSIHVYYLYMRSFFNEVVVPARHQKAYQYILSESGKKWTSLNLRGQAIMALVAKRNNNATLADQILKSLKENSLYSDEMGMYWKELNNPSHYWWGYPIENHALLMEAFYELENNVDRLNDLKTWLLKNKQTNHWHTNSATADAVYALLLTGSNWLEADLQATMTAGNWTVRANTANDGLGYIKETIDGEKVRPEMGNIQVTVKPAPGRDASGISSWGAYYWQYFEEMDKVGSAETGLKVSKKIYKQENTEKGPQLVPVNEETLLQTGDKVRIVLQFSADREMDYVHIKDLRAASFEPINQVSGYRYQSGLWFYQSPKDLSMNYYFRQLPRGSYTLEYELMVTHAGTFLDGIATIQCLYAPEFAGHDGGQKLSIETAN